MDRQTTQEQGKGSPGDCKDQGGQGQKEEIDYQLPKQKKKQNIFENRLNVHQTQKVGERGLAGRGGQGAIGEIPIFSMSSAVYYRRIAEMEQEGGGGDSLFLFSFFWLLDSTSFTTAQL